MFILVGLKVRPLDHVLMALKIKSVFIMVFMIHKHMKIKQKQMIGPCAMRGKIAHSASAGVSPQAIQVTLPFVVN